MKLMLEKAPIHRQLHDETDVVRRCRGAERFTPWIVITVRLVATLQLITSAASAVSTDLVDYTLYGGAYESASTTSYSEVHARIYTRLDELTTALNTPAPVLNSTNICSHHFDELDESAGRRSWGNEIP